MIKYFLPLTFLCFCTFSVFGQNLVFPSSRGNNSDLRMDCTTFDWIAGTSSQALDPAAQTNDIEYLCFNDALIITHDGNFSLDPASDPEPANAPGIYYAATLDCPIDVSGPTVADINTSTCAATNPVELFGTPGLYNFVLDGLVDAGGSGTFTNNGTIQNAVDGGNPVELFFVPITVDDHANFTNDYWFEGVDACVNATPSDAFRVVYLNEITAGNINNNTGTSCQGSFDISGGFPEWEQLNGSNSNYTITIAENGNPTNTGTVTSGVAIHNATVSFSVPSGGMYDITVEDGKSCGVSFSVDMSACVTSVAATYTSTDVTCNGDTNGSILVDINTGTAPFNIDWQLQTGGAVQNGTLPTGNQFDITGLAPGTYDVTITDANGIQDTGVATVGEPGALGASFINLMQPTCNGESTGSITVEITSGGVIITPDASYTFDWGTSSTQTTQIITNIPSGAYNVVVTDGNGCTATAASTLSQPAAITAPAITVVDASCAGVADGSATINASGGTGTLVYNWSTTPAQTTATATNLEPGTYTVTVTDDNSCQYTDVATVGANTVLIATAVATDISCNGAGDGEVLATPIVTSGVDNGGYNFAWSPSGTGATISSLTPNTYTVTITDANGCTAVAQDDVIEPAVLAVTTTITNESCSAGNDGQVMTTVTGGTGAYTYIWSNIETSEDITGLLGGTYTVTVSDANSCTATAEGTVGSPTGPTINSLDAVDVLCATDTNGSITANAVQGTDPIASYLWSNAATTATNSNLAPGTYTVTVTDTGGCESTASATVNAPAALVELSPYTATRASCPGGGDASLTLDIGGGLPISATVPYSYNWSNGVNSGQSTSNTITNLTPGNYDITVTDGNNCTLIIAGAVVPDTPPITLNFSSIQPVSCFAGVPCDGQATVAASGGLSTSYAFTWATGETSATATQLCQGFQLVTVTDGFCSIVDSVEILAPPIVSVGGIATTDVTCFGDTDATATITPTGGDGGPYTVTWSNGQTGLTATDLDPNIVYTVSITDGQGCQSPAGFSVTVNQPQALSLLVVDTVDISCNGEDDGLIQVAPVGGNQGTFTYQWSPNTTNDLNIASSLPVGDYSVTVTDVNGCTATAVADVDEPELIVFEYTPPVEPECNGYTTVFGIDTVYGGDGGPYIYTIDEFNFQSTNQASPVLAGEYTITVTDSIGCSVSEMITINEPAEIIVDLGPDVEIQLGESYEIIPNVTPLGALDSLIWSPAIALDCTDCFNPTASPLDDQVYSLTVIDDAGCFGTGDLFIDVDPNRNVYIPNAFSPNGDGANDFFSPYVGVGVENINQIMIFDRWGEVVYHENDFQPDGIGNNGWDGRLGGKIMNPAVFVYIIEVAFADGQVLTYKGDVTLIK